MPRDPRHTVHEGRHIAWRSAWDTFGRRHWRWFVYGRLLVPALVLAGIALPVVIAWRTVNVDIKIVGMGAIALGVLDIALGVTMRLSMASVRASMRGRLPATPTVLMATGTILIVFGGLVLTL